MNCSVKQQTAAFELTWSLTTTRGATPQENLLKLQYQIEAFEELFVADRLWLYDEARKRTPDPQGIYRFVDDGRLLLVFAQSPVPTRVLPRVVFQPLYSRILARETRQREVLLELPVAEYSALAQNLGAPTALEAVSRVVFAMSYRRRSSMDKDPEPPPKETAEAAGYIVHDPELIVSYAEVDELPVKRRTGDIARFVVPAPRRVPT